ncbi:hypothetical protein ES703_52220 [subsurface metagenome]
MSNSACPTPTVSIIITSIPYASYNKLMSKTALDMPPLYPLEARLLRNILGCNDISVIRTLSPKNAPPLKGDVGSTHIIPIDFPSSNNLLDISPVNVLFPTPGEPVIPII